MHVIYASNLKMHPKHDFSESDESCKLVIIEITSVMQS